VSGRLPARRTLLSIDRSRGRRQKGAEMYSAAYKKRLATAIAGAALASALAVSGASAHYGSQPVSSPEVAPPPSSIAASAAEEYQDLRSPDAVEAPVPEPQPVADEPSEPAGFDLASAAIGAVVAGGLSLVLMATLGMRRAPRRRPAGA
jgi:hypothetical protein